MLLLFETSNGAAVFKACKIDDLKKSPASLELVSFVKHKTLKRSLRASKRFAEGKISREAKKAIKKSIKEYSELPIGIYDKTLAKSIKKAFKVECTHGENVNEIFREIRSNFDKYTSKSDNVENKDMSLSLSHSVSTQKIKLSNEKIDVMIIQAINLIEEIDTELNTYLMRIKEWYGWHFPELVTIITDNEKYVKFVIMVGSQNNLNIDASSLIDEDTEKKIKEASKVSLGTEINTEDEENIKILCKQYLEMNEYKETIATYLKKRMRALAPNITELVGEIIGAKLIAKAGSLINLAKTPASTVQIFGAEKALFRALKTKGNTPKYGLIYHAKLIKDQKKKKGKLARMLAGKISLASRVDAAGSKSNDYGLTLKNKLLKLVLVNG